MLQLHIFNVAMLYFDITKERQFNYLFIRGCLHQIIEKYKGGARRKCRT
jgi:hypothetical protein